MKRSTERILTSHVGALHVPPALQDLLLEEWTDQPHDEAHLAAELRQGVADIVKRQADLGIDIVNDGELSKSTWMAYAIERLSGFQLDAGRQINRHSASKDRVDFDRFYAEAGDQTYYMEPSMKRAFDKVYERSLQVVCNGPITYTGQAAVQRDIDNLKAALEGVQVEEAFLPVVAPGSVQPWIINDHYGSDDALFGALADALKQEYKAIIDAGFICQIDDAFLPHEYDRRLAQPDWDMDQYMRWAELSVEALNAAVEGLPQDRLRYHICWGSWNAPHSGDIELPQIVDLLLKMNVQTYAIEAANARHEWEHQVWADVDWPEEKILMPGVIEHTTHVVEHPRTVADRILRFANVLGRENVIAGTDCGFRGRSHPQVAWAKLTSLVEGAQIASDELWGRSRSKTSATAAATS